MVQFIDDHRAGLGVEPICAVLPIATSTYYRHRHQRTIRRAGPRGRNATTQLRVEIQRATNQNTNGLLAPLLPKGADLNRHSARDIAAVAATLNRRPRKTLSWRLPPKSSTNCYSHTNEDALRDRLSPASISRCGYTDRLVAAGIATSVGSQGDTYDHALAEVGDRRVQ